MICHANNPREILRGAKPAELPVEQPTKFDIGRPKEIAEVKALARSHTTTAINTLVSIAKSKKATDAARVSACIALLDRGWGKPEARQCALVIPRRFVCRLHN
jgi:hypothetical protein